MKNPNATSETRVPLVRPDDLPRMYRELCEYSQILRAERIKLEKKIGLLPAE